MVIGTPTVIAGVFILCVCVCVCVCACLHNNSKTNDPKVFKLGVGNTNQLGMFYRVQMIWFWDQKVNGQG